MTSNLAERFDTVVAVMTEDEARTTEQEILTTGNRLRVLLVDFYERRGWEVLGYASWRAWAATRLGESERSAYRELTAGLVEREIVTHVSELGSAPVRQLQPLTTFVDMPRGPGADTRPIHIDSNAIRETWDRALEIAEQEGKPLVARHVTQAVEERQAPAPRSIDPLFDPTPRPGDYWTDDDDHADVLPFAEAPPAAPPALAPHQRINASTNNEWYTPRPFLDAAHEVMGEIDLDPASNPLANETVRAARYFTSDDDGFEQPWQGRVWLNPPYGTEQGESNQARWSQRLIAEYEVGNVSEAILLVNAVPGNAWFTPLKNYPICFPDSRIRFYNAQTEAGQPTHSNALVYFGNNVADFVRVFSRFGAVMARLVVTDGEISIYQGEGYERL